MTTLAPKSPHPPSTDRLHVAGHDLTLFVESPPLIDAMVADILAAKSRIWLETYIFFNDHAGQKIANALKQKAAQGLEIKLLYDALGSLSTPRSFFTDLAQHNIQIHAFHSLLEGLRKFRPLSFFNRRDHRKLLIIDSSIAYFGGMNLVETAESVEAQKAQSKPTSSGWRDVHIRLQGPKQPELAESFDRSWRRALGEPIPKRPKHYRKADLNIRTRSVSEGLRTRSDSEGQSDASSPISPPDSIHFFDSGPGKKVSRASRIFTRLIHAAKHNITLSMAYFLPTGQSLRALLAARRRNVHIRVIVPGKSDVMLVQRATARLYDKLIRRQFRIYERQHRMLHAKTMIIDDTWSLVGSANLDPRSLYINLELLAIIRSPAFAAKLTQIARYEIAHSARITKSDCQKIPPLQRFLNRLAWSLRWWL